MAVWLLFAIEMYFMQGRKAGDWLWNPGFVQSLEFLKKSGNLRTTFPDLEKVWKLKAKS